MKHKNDFEFNYVAPTTEERKEIESIKNHYVAQSNGSNKLNELRKLDSKVKNTPQILALVFGVVGTLVFGLGLSMVLEWNITIWGCIVSSLGFIPTILAYPIYKLSYSKLKKKYSAKIIKLSEELLNNENKQV